MTASPKRLLALILGLAALTLGPATGLRADDQTPPPSDAPSLSDEVGDALGKITPFLNAKDWTGALKVVDDIIPNAKPDTYDLEVLYDTKARVLIQKGDYDGALFPMEEALKISDRHHYKNARQNLDDLYLLSQLCYQQAGDAKKSKDEQIAFYQKAITYIERWFTINAKPNEEISIYYATLLYQEATTINGEHPDADLVKKTQQVLQAALKINAHPKETLYILLLLTYQQQGNIPKAAEILEFILQEHPNNKSYWPDLVGFYANMAQSSGKEDETFRRNYIRAINALERAQALGFMKTPKDSYLLFTFYYDMGQYGTAADLLHDGLMSGNIESTVMNWELLSTSYQQTNQDFKAIEILKEAAKRFPDNGQFYFNAAQIYTAMDKNEDAYEYTKLAVERGGIEKPWIVYMNLAYSGYELEKFDEAKAAIDKAISLKPGTPDPQAKRLKAAIDEAIKERDDRAAKKAAAN